MARRITWAEPAWVDLESAAEYISRDSPHYAAAFVQEVRSAVESLSELGERGQMVPEFRDPTIRELLVRPYRVVYQILPDELRIVAVIHGSRRLRR